MVCICDIIYHFRFNFLTRLDSNLRQSVEPDRKSDRFFHKATTILLFHSVLFVQANFNLYICIQTFKSSDVWPNSSIRLQI